MLSLVIYVLRFTTGIIKILSDNEEISLPSCFSLEICTIIHPVTLVHVCATFLTSMVEYVA